MRTTIRIDDELLREAKSRAASSGRTLTAVVEDALRAAMHQRHGPTQASRIALPTFAGSGLQPGVDIDDSAALLDLMDEMPG